MRGTIQNIKDEGTSDPLGIHILIQTTRGVFDVHLGFGSGMSAYSLGLKVGQPVRVVGMMRTNGATNVLLARILTTTDRIVVLRNERGIPARLTPVQSAPAANDRQDNL